GGQVDLARLIPLGVIPLIGVVGLAIVAFGLRRGSHGWPFIGAALMFFSGYLGLAVSFFPYVAPYSMTFRDAANADNALALMLVGVGILLPVIIGYSVWVYWIFRGKVTADAGYH
ncbi:MAG: cytochrome d ubiquinol oxidase subunit II, partial [Phenylobacterium sp.]